MIDDLDVKIIKELIIDAKKRPSDLSRELDTNESTIRYRVRRLEELGVITGYRAKINYQRAGLAVSITGIDVEPEHLWTVLHELRKIDDINQVYLTTGDHILIVEVIASNKESLERVHELISRLPGVKRVCPSIVTDIYK